MRRVLQTVAHIAPTDSTAFIHGESGTGKELVARAIHCSSKRKDKPFVAVNCAALPETLLESELFGHQKGAFTGAVKSSRGLFVQAHTGTIFLDEIGDMPLAIQAKLLRVLQERQFHPVGGDAPVQVDVRVIVATNKDLAEGVRQGLFREDLYYRIHVIPILLPPLRGRREDIPLLVEHFLRKYGASMDKPVRAVAPGAMQRLLGHDWPGNVRELENAIEYAVAMTREDIIPEALFPGLADVMPREGIKSLKQARDSFEKEYLCGLLEITNGTVSAAATLAGKYRADFYQLLKKHGIDPAAYKKQHAAPQEI
jgi:two-component system response regulator GlrR